MGLSCGRIIFIQGCLLLNIIRIHDDRFHGGFNLCCKKTRQEKLEFILIVNVSPEEMELVHKFVTTESQTQWDRSLEYYDCSCYWLYQPFQFISYWWLLGSIIIFYLFKQCKQGT